MKLLWIAQITKKNSYSKVSLDYIEMIRNFTDWDLKLYNVSHDTPQSELFDAVINFQPDFIIILHNDGEMRDITRRLDTIRSEWKGKLIAFVPIDHEVDGHFRSIICDRYWTMTSWAAEQIRGVNPTYLTTVGVLPHLVEDYHKISDRKRISIRKRLYGSFSNRYIIGMVNANNGRKRLDLGIHAFRAFHQKVPNSLLVIKTTTPEKGFSCQVYEDWSIFTKDLPVLVFEDRITESELNDFYNSFDLMINPTDGEGFGLTPFEGALAGTLSILPYHSAFLSLLPAPRPRFCIDFQPVPQEYARSTVDYLRRRSGLDKFCFVEGRCCISPRETEQPSQIYNLNCEKCYIVSFGKKINASLSLTGVSNDEIGESDVEVFLSSDYLDMDKIAHLISTDRPDSFQIQVTSDLESLQYFLSWRQSNSLLSRLGHLYSIHSTSLSSIRSFIGSPSSSKGNLNEFSYKQTTGRALISSPTVGIIDPVEMCEKMYYYYLNPDSKNEDLEIFRRHVKENFNSKKILEQMSFLLGW